MARRARIGIIGAGWWAALNHLPVAEGQSRLRRGGGQPARPRRTPERAARLRRAAGLRGLARDARHGAEWTVSSCRRPTCSTTSMPRRPSPRAATCWSRSRCHHHRRRPRPRAARRRPRSADRCRLRLELQGLDRGRARSRPAGRIGRVEHVVLQMASALEDLFAGEPMRETEGHMFRPPASTWADPAAGRGLRLGPARPCARPAVPHHGSEPDAVFASTQIARRGRHPRCRRSPLRQRRDRRRCPARPRCRSTGGSRSTCACSATRGCCCSTSSVSGWRCAAATATTPWCRSRRARAPTPASGRSRCWSTSVSAGRPSMPRPVRSGCTPSRYWTRCTGRPRAEPWRRSAP